MATTNMDKLAAAHDAVLGDVQAEDDPTTAYGAVVDLVGWHQRQLAALATLATPGADTEG